MPHPRFAACVFDAYGTLFDVHSVAARAEALAPRQGADLSRLWRTKQLEYTWLASLMMSPDYARPDFQDVTAMALDYAVAALALPLCAHGTAAKPASGPYVHQLQLAVTGARAEVRLNGFPLGEASSGSSFSAPVNRM